MAGYAQIVSVFEQLDVVIRAVQFQDGASGLQRVRNLDGDPRPQGIIRHRFIETADQARKPRINDRLRQYSVHRACPFSRKLLREPGHIFWQHVYCVDNHVGFLTGTRPGFDEIDDTVADEIPAGSEMDGIFNRHLCISGRNKDFP